LPQRHWERSLKSGLARASALEHAQEVRVKIKLKFVRQPFSGKLARNA